MYVIMETNFSKGSEALNFSQILKDLSNFHYIHISLMKSHNIWDRDGYFKNKHVFHFEKIN